MSLATLLLGAALTLPPATPELPTLPQQLDYAGLATLPVQHDGRWMPLDTLARDLVWSITGDASFAGEQPIGLLLGMMFRYDLWRQTPLVPVANAELRAAIGLPADAERFSYDQLVSHRGLHRLIDELAALDPEAPRDPLQKKVAQIEARLITMQQVFFGQALRPIPHPDDPDGLWLSIGWLLQSGSEGTGPAAQAWLGLRQAFLGGDGMQFLSATGRFKAELQRMPAAWRPPLEPIEREAAHNQVAPLSLAWKLLLAGALCGGLGMALRIRWGRRAAVALLVAGLGILSWGLWMRGVFAGRLPAANMFESLLFLSWGAGAIGLVGYAITRGPGVALVSCTTAGGVLALADLLPMDPFIRPIAPVLLDTIWMSIHVPIIMVSYSVLALAVLVAHAHLLASALAPRRPELLGRLERTHALAMHVGAILLFVGIATGSIWASSSWGRYWGWDPKEVWSLVAFLAYMVVMHVRVDPDATPRWGKVLAGVAFVAVLATVGEVAGAPSAPGLALLAGLLGVLFFFLLGRGPLATSVKSTVAFWLVITTYVVVNYVLGTGLHSYGFGTGAIARSVLSLAVLDLVFVVACVATCLRRQPGGAAALLRTPRAAP